MHYIISKPQQKHGEMSSVACPLKKCYPRGGHRAGDGGGKLSVWSRRSSLLAIGMTWGNKSTFSRHLCCKLLHQDNIQELLSGLRHVLLILEHPAQAWDTKNKVLSKYSLLNFLFKNWRSIRKQRHFAFSSVTSFWKLITICEKSVHSNTLYEKSL